MAYLVFYESISRIQMSFKDLVKYLDKHQVERPVNYRDRTLIVVSDSKGSRLQSLVESSYPEKDIVWHCKGGRTSFQAASFIQHNVEQFNRVYGSILIAVWTGICDLTNFIESYESGEHRPAKRRRRCIDLSEVTVDDIIKQYNRILAVTAVYRPKVRVVFLECPQYSVEIWNQHQYCRNPEIFKDSTSILLDKIEYLNRAIQEVNASNGISAPKFGLDLIKSRKSNKSHSTVKVSFSLLVDGIHPDVTLSKYWLRRLVLHLQIPYCQD